MQKFLRYALILLVFFSAVTVTYYHATLLTSNKTSRLVRHKKGRSAIVGKLQNQHHHLRMPVLRITTSTRDEQRRLTEKKLIQQRQRKWTERKESLHVLNRKGGRDGADDSHKGLVRDPRDGMLHAWRSTSDPLLRKCPAA